MPTMEFMGGRKWRAAAYTRLSKEEDGHSTSNSIKSQKRIIEDYVEQYDDIEIVEYFDDDGWSGSNFDRPGFKDMMDAVDEGLINCIIVKDLSRFGRNYLDAGNYQERVFPAKGVRLIAIGDSYDGAKQASYADSFMTPFKNLINDNYCATTSKKTKDHLNASRQRGKYVGSFAPYGYLKDPEDRHHLVVDREVEETIRQIFRWKVEGASASAIARKLNERGVKSPQELRHSRGSNHYQPMQVGKGQWHARTVLRILKDEVYIGNLLQGKWFKPSFRSKVVMPRPPEEWYRTNGTHEAIIDEVTFDKVQKALRLNTRVYEGYEEYSLLSGLVFCADCGGKMYQHNITRTRKRKPGKKVFRYLSCKNHKDHKEFCSSHSIRLEDAIEAVQVSVLNMVASLADARELWEIGAEARRQRNVGSELRRLEDELKADIERCKGMRLRLYEDLAKGLIDEADREEFNAIYISQIADKEAQLEKATAERIALENAAVDDSWISLVERWSDAKHVDRAMLVDLVERIEVHEDKSITIKYTFQDSLDQLKEE